MAAYLRAYNRLGLKGMLQHLYMFRCIKEGTLMGTDAYGNKYYQNLELEYGQHRWFEPPVWEAANMQETTAISPEWHGWMHCSTDVLPPSIAPTLKRTGPPILSHSDNPMTTHAVGPELRAPWRPNPTLRRERGYGIKVYQTMYQNGTPGENAFYVQPGNIVSPLFKSKQKAQAQFLDLSPISSTDGWEPTTKAQEAKARRELLNRKERELEGKAA